MTRRPTGPTRTDPPQEVAGMTALSLLRVLTPTLSLSDVLSVGYDLGNGVGYEAGYRDGFPAGAEVGAAGILLHIEQALGGTLPALLPELPYVGEYERLRRLRSELPDEPCKRQCGICSDCYYVKRRASNLAQYGTPDFPGRDALALRRTA
jgi:hypothetical protein